MKVHIHMEGKGGEGPKHNGFTTERTPLKTAGAGIQRNDASPCARPCRRHLRIAADRRRRRRHRRLASAHVCAVLRVAPCARLAAALARPERGGGLRRQLGAASWNRVRQARRHNLLLVPARRAPLERGSRRGGRPRGSACRDRAVLGRPTRSRHALRTIIPAGARADPCARTLPTLLARHPRPAAALALTPRSRGGLAPPRTSDWKMGGLWPWHSCALPVEPRSLDSGNRAHSPLVTWTTT